MELTELLNGWVECLKVIFPQDKLPNNSKHLQN